MSENSSELDREPRTFRTHETYQEDHWTVVDVSGIDKVFATPALDRHNESIRIDVDGVGAQSVMQDFEIEGDNVNSSFWLPLPEAVELREQLDAAIEEAKHE